jgi:pyrroline-5-carboxylate reductase
MTRGRFKLKGTLAVVGGGRMGEAILSGLLSAEAVGPADVVVAEPDAKRRQTLDAAHGVTTTESAAEAAREGDIIVLAVKPQIIDDVLDSISSEVSGALVISIAAGITCARIESQLPADTPVIRVMPNTPAMVGEGMSVVSGGAAAEDEQVDLARELMGLLGKAIVLPEEHQNVATAISGSGPAYVAVFVDALTRAGERNGLARDDARLLAVQTVRGTAGLLEGADMQPDTLIDSVASPGGTTVAALGALDENGFASAVSAAVEAAIRRAEELGA